MSTLFGGKEIICDGCAMVWPSGINVQPGSVIIDADTFTGFAGSNVDGGSHVIRVDFMTRHFCADCAGVALDRLREAFERQPIVRNLCESEPGDPDFVADDPRCVS